MNARSFAPLAVLVFAGVLTAADPVPRPIDTAKPGQWVIEKHTTSSVGSSNLAFRPIGQWCELPTAFIDSTQTTYVLTWVDSVDGPRVHLKRQAIAADLKTGLARPTDLVINREKPVAGPVDDTKSVYTTDDEVLIGNDPTPLRCKRVDVVVIDEVYGPRHTIRWSSDSIPLFGLIKALWLDTDGDEVEGTRLVRWGESGGAERPLLERP